MISYCSSGSKASAREIGRLYKQQVANMVICTSLSTALETNRTVVMTPMIMDSYNCDKYISHPISLYDETVFLVYYKEGRNIISR